MAEIWQSLENPFVNATKESYITAMKLSNYHEAFLRQLTINEPAEPDWITLHTRYLPLHNGLVSVYTTWSSFKALQKSKTALLKELLDKITENINEWDLQVQNVYRKTNPLYQAIFPQGHKPFQQGAIDKKILEVATLIENMEGDAALDAVRALVETYHDDLDGARDKQEAAKAQTQSISVDVATAVKAAMVGEWQNNGFLINKWPDEPERIEPFHDLQELRKKQQTRFTGTLAIGLNKDIFVRTLTTDSELRLKITGPGPVKFYLATTKNGTDSTAVTADADSDQTIEASAFGITEYGLHRHLTAVNESGAETQFEVEIL